MVSGHVCLDDEDAEEDVAEPVEQAEPVVVVEVRELGEQRACDVEALRGDVI